jgi:hypothetical protein
LERKEGYCGRNIIWEAVIRNRWNEKVIAVLTTDDKDWGL